MPFEIEVEVDLAGVRCERVEGAFGLLRRSAALHLQWVCGDLDALARQSLADLTRAYHFEVNLHYWMNRRFPQTKTSRSKRAIM